MEEQMENKKKGSGILSAVLFGCVVFVVVAAAGLGIYRLTAGDGTYVRYPDYSESYYVNDYCSMLSEQAERTIAAEAERLSSLTGAQVVVAAVPDTQQIPIEDYSRKLANAWGIGGANKNNGVLILLSKSSKSIRLEVGKGLEDLLPDEKAGEILDQYAVHPIENDKWNVAASGTCMAVLRILYAYNGLDAPRSLQIVREPVTADEAITAADMDFEEASARKKPKAHGSGRFAGCGATRP